MPQEPVATTFQGHITEFIKRMKIVLVTFILSALVVLVLPGNSDFLATTENYAPLMSVFLSRISEMFLPENIKLFAVSISDPITLYVFAAVVFAVAITLPVFAYETYKFIDPALHPQERKMVFPFVTAVSALFTVGAVFGFFFLFPSFLQGIFPFFSAVGAEPWFPIMDFYNMLFFTVIVSGLLFTIPAFFVLLTKFGILRTSMFTKKRKYIYLGLIVAAMLISPGATPQGNLYLFIVLAAMFEISMILGRKYGRKPVTDAKDPIVIETSAIRAKCRYCGSKIKPDAKYCSNCKKYLE